MGNSQSYSGKEPDVLHATQKPMAEGCYVFPIAENEDAVICTTSVSVHRKNQLKLKQKQKQKKTAVGNARFVESALLQAQGRYIVKPKNNGMDGQLMQVKSTNPNSKKIYFVPRQMVNSPGLSQVKTEIRTIRVQNCEEDNEDFKINLNNN